MTSRRRLGCCFTCALTAIWLCACTQKQAATAPAPIPEADGTHKQATTSPAVEELREIGQLRGLLRPGVFEAKEWNVAGSPRLIDLTERMTEAVREDPAWFLDYVAKSKPGEPLAYHPKLGMSGAEYQEYLQLADTMTLQETGTAVMHISETKEGVHIRIESDERPSAELSLDFESGRLQTAIGPVGPPELLGADAGFRTLGTITGFKWHEETGSLERGDASAFSLKVGRVRRDGQGVLYYKLQRQQHGAVEDVRHLVVWPNRPPG